MSPYSFHMINPIMLEYLWPQLMVHLERVIKVSNGEFTEETIYNRAMNGGSVIVTVNMGSEIIAVTTIEVVTYDSGLKSLLIPIFGGDKMFSWGEDFLVFLKMLAKKYGCTELRGMAVRDGWMRALKNKGWSESYVVIKCPLEY